MTVRDSKSDGDCGFLFLTERCNLACRHCYVSAHPGPNGAMELEVVVRALEVFEQLGIFDIRLTGGEATIHPEFNRIVEEAHDREFRMRLLSNGLNLLRSGDSLAWLDQVAHTWVSLYGPDAESHKEVSGRTAPAMENIIECISGLVAEGHSVGLSVAILPGTVGKVQRLLDDVSKAGIRKIRLIPIQPDGRARTALRCDWSSWEQQIRSLYEELCETAQSQRFEVFSLNDPFDLGNRQSGGQSCLLHKRAMFSVVPNGEIYPCCFTAYERGRSICNVLDKDPANQLADWCKIGVGTTPCRAFEASFWEDVKPRRVSCPISIADLGP